MEVTECQHGPSRKAPARPLLLQRLPAYHCMIAEHVISSEEAYFTVMLYFCFQLILEILYLCMLWGRSDRCGVFESLLLVGVLVVVVVVVY